MAVRVRPHNSEENSHEIVQISNAKTVTLLDSDYGAAKDPVRSNRARLKSYTFDLCLPPETTQHEVFEKTTKGLIEGVI